MKITIEISDKVVSDVVKRMHHSFPEIGCSYVAAKIEEAAMGSLSKADFIKLAEDSIIKVEQKQ